MGEIKPYGTNAIQVTAKCKLIEVLFIGFVREIQVD